MSIEPKKTGIRVELNTPTVKLHKSWVGIRRPDEKVLRLLRSEFIAFLNANIETQHVAIKEAQSSIEIYDKDNEKDAFAQFNIIRDPNEDQVIIVSGFAPQELIDIVVSIQEGLVQRFSPHIPDLKPEINLKGKKLVIKFDLTAQE